MILFVHPVNDHTGSTNVLSQVISEKIKTSRCVLFTMDGDGFCSNLSGLKIVNIPRFQVNHKSIPILSLLLSYIYRIIIFVPYCYHADLVYINTIKPVYAYTISRLFRKTVIWHVHEKIINKSVFSRIQEFYVEHSKAHFIFVSKYLSEQYKLLSSSTYEIKPNCLNNIFISRIDINPIFKRERKNVMMACGYNEAKGISKFVEVSHSLPDLKFILVLSTDQDTVNCFVKEKTPPVNCKVLPRQTQMGNIYKNVDILLNLSNPFLCVETFGLTIIEAFAYGIPAIVPNVGGPIEIVQDGYNGKIVNVLSVDDIRKAILEIMSINNYEKYANNALLSSKKYINAR